MNKSAKKRNSPSTTIDQLKRYGYSSGVLLGLFGMGTVLLFGSPTFSLSPATATFDFYVYPVLIVLGLLLVRAILSGRIPIEKFEKPLVGFAALFFVSKFSFTLLSAPTLLSLAFVESWYWMMVGIWTFTFLAHSFYPALFINLTIYLAAVAVTVTNGWLKSNPAMFWSFLSDVIASNFRLSASLTTLVVLGYIKHQWVFVEKEAMLLRRIAHKDALTGLPNRRHLNDTLQAALKKPAEKLSIILFDLDGFKEVNDHFGHTAGDDVLRQISALALSCVRSRDVVGRWGGEEFLIICPETTLSDGLRLAERLRLEFASHPMPHGRTITGSFGVAELQPGETPEHLVARADAALYRAKEQGKNQVRPSTAVGSP